MFSALCHKGGVICISEVIDISPGNLESSLCFIQPSVSHDVLCIEVKISRVTIYSLDVLLSLFGKMVQINLFGGRNRDADIENGLVDMGGEEEC